MKIDAIATTNFGSYEEFNMGFGDMGLALIHGPTGSGKSTLMDMVSWCLYGVTAKGLAVDEVRSWHSKENTTGMITVEINGNMVTILRERGNRAHDNDLYMLENGIEIRGKDATETQQLICQRLGASAEEFITASYFHEFSDAANFFVAKAKDRRNLFEQLAPLEFPKDLAEKSAAAKKQVKAKLVEAEKEYTAENAKLQQLIETRNSTIKASDSWMRGHAKNIIEIENLLKNYDTEKKNKKDSLKVKFLNFEDNRKKHIDKLKKRSDELDEKIAQYVPVPVKEAREIKCKSCGQMINKSQEDLWKAKEALRNHQDNLKEKKMVDENLAGWEIVNTYQEQIDALDAQENPYVEQLDRENKRVNPFVDQIESAIEKVTATGANVSKLLTSVKALEAKISDLGQLYDLSSVLRAELLKRTVGAINDKVNNILETYFDSELRVTLVLDEDNLDANIQKGGFDCNYRQLSKGQRQLLRLSFVVAVQEALSNKLAVSFQNLFFDEALDGLDEELKIKAFALFEALSLNHESILIIDHSRAFHNMFDKKLRVTMVGDKSKIEEEYEQP
jgi:DNA repair exonuclease SbcCD ATPase subunit